MKLAALLTNLLKKSGVDITQQELAPLFAIDMEVPDAIATQVEKSLMTAEAAKSHTDVRSFIRTEVLNGVDKKVAGILEELGIEDATDVVEEKNSYEKIGKLAKAIKAVEAKKVGATGKEKEGYEKQVQELSGKLKIATESLTAKEKEFLEARQNDLTNFELHKKLLGKEYSLPKEMDADIVLSTAQAAINKALAAQGFSIARDQKSGTLLVLNKDGVPAISSTTNEAVEINSFIDGALAQNKLLKVNGQDPGSGGGNTHSIIAGGEGQKGNQQIVNEIDSQLFK